MYHVALPFTSVSTVAEGSTNMEPFGPLETAEHNASDFAMGLFFDSTVAVVLAANSQKLDDEDMQIVNSMFDELFVNPIEIDA